jgi:hypothetical protein
VFSSSQLGLALAASLEALYPGKIGLEGNRDLIGSSAVIAALRAGTDASAASKSRIQEFLDLRRKFLLYN